ncbi:enoyl-CoA hydratase/isomerase family protein [Haliscomenobacter hydrossis]|uniref:Enoyl-CoA hydratase n=1 Tax=Haliscomenobacter hydrossis (strain ATCC 27775 / DSM 1100 / LMG 10767 / O) TaxID=760192 RepID=F4L4M3_HALH1|nr:enoyl-CoA hydratase-related protein [Haliscomenobacter hydrossis]AEE52971.1 Enoyl-CoA hydratase [Haliscomenobacter hydrossis DSM 1100]
MTYENLLLTEENNILLVTFNREKALNALNRRTMLEINHLFSNDLPQRTHLKGIILTGAGDRAFVAGADIKEFLEMEGDLGRQMAQYGQDTFFLIERFPKPVVAAVNGFALGGGCELAMACHLRVAGEKARFGQPEVNLGIIPGYGGTQRLTQLIGKGKALEFCMTADMIDAPEAYRLGLVNYVVPAGEEVNMAKKLIEKTASKGPIAIAKVIESVNAFFEDGVDGFACEIKAFGETTNTLDFREGATAFIEKRVANFAGK